MAVADRSADENRDYRAMIDELVDQCRTGQGAIEPRRVRSGALLATLDDETREAVATLLEEAFSAGVHTTLATLHWHEVPPFEDGYEGTPFHDFIGRLTLDDWDWPD